MDGVKACMNIYTQYTIRKINNETIQPYTTILKLTFSFVMNA